MSNRISAIGEGDYETSTQSAELVEAVQAIYQRKGPEPQANSEDKGLSNEPLLVGESTIQEHVDTLNKKLAQHNKYAEYSVHDVTNQIMVKIIDKETGEVLKELPPEKMLDMVAKMWEHFGIMVDKKI